MASKKLETEAAQEMAKINELLDAGASIAGVSPENVATAKAFLGTDKALAPTVEPEKKKGKKKSATAEQAIVTLNQQGIAIPKNIDAAFRIADAMFKGGSFPKWIQNSMQALAISQFCRSLRLDPMTGVQHVCMVNGRLSLWGEGPLAAVRAYGQLASIREIFVTSDYKEISLANKNLDAPLFAVICQLKRRHPDGTIEEIERSFTKKDEEKAMKGLPDVWKGYQRIMYKRKARAEAIKDLFGDVVAGARIAEYDDNFAPDALTEGKPQASLAEQMTSLAIEDKTSA